MWSSDMRGCNHPQVEREGGGQRSSKDRKVPALKATMRVLRGTGGAGGLRAREQVALMPMAAERPGGAGPGSSEVAGSLKSHSRGDGDILTGQMLAEPRGVEDKESGVSGHERDSTWWREEARWGDSCGRKGHSNTEGRGMSGFRVEKKAEVLENRFVGGAGAEGVRVHVCAGVCGGGECDMGSGTGG